MSNIGQKASRQLNVLKKSDKYLNRVGKLTLYHSVIVSNLKFAPNMPLLQWKQH